MNLFTVEEKGDFAKTFKYLDKLAEKPYRDALQKYGQMGVAALASATPVKSGKTASSWKYDINIETDKAEIIWSNTNINKGVNIAIILQYGHGTRNGGYVRGTDYINPAMQKIFDQLADEAWKKVVEL